MNILLACYWPLPHLGGVWPYMLQIKTRLERMGHTVDLFGNGPDIAKYYMVYQNREVNKVELLPALKAKLNEQVAPALHADSWVFSVETDRYCMELSAASFGLKKYDVIHCQDVISAIALSRVKSQHTGLVVSVHGSLAREVMFSLQKDPNVDMNHSPIWKYYKAIENLGATAGDVTLTSTQWMGDLLKNEFGVPSRQIRTFPYGLDEEKFYADVNRGTYIQKPPGKKVIICPARLVYIKGIQHLIPALANVKSVRNDWVCWIVGDGDQRQQLELQAAELGLKEDVIFLGHRDDVPALLMKADIFAHPSLQDNQPFSVMEAQLAGLPSVVTAAGGLPEAVRHGETGLVSPIGDVEKLGDNLHLLLANDQLRLTYGKNAKEWATKQWSLSLMIKRVLNCYEYAIEKGKARRSHE
ncbi:MAG: glycosyltransferase family 4 protein [Gorillibacterium sp.]|nr:glycosyltransferase family 4 protein [Gorillibacterium sp.]